MRRTVLILPDLLTEPGDGSPLRQTLPYLKVLAEAGTVFRLARPPKIETPEALYLGMSSTEGQMRQGPLTVSALGADPPDRSTHFHLSLGSFQDGILSFPSDKSDLTNLVERIQKLNTKTLTTLVGEGLDHALVWEGLGDLGTTAPTDAQGRSIKDSLPEGDNERALRRFVDDSINILAETSVNQERIEEGLPPLNVLWPWGHGQRQKVPNLFLRRGELAVVESASMRLAGLTRLSGYRHEDRRLYGRPDEPAFQAMAQRALKRDLTILVFDPAAYGDRERAEWFVHELDRLFLAPFIENRTTETSRMTILTNAIGLTTDFPLKSENDLPFDERIIDDQKLPAFDLDESVERAIAPPV